MALIEERPIVLKRLCDRSLHGWFSTLALSLLERDPSIESADYLVSHGMNAKELLAEALEIELAGPGVDRLRSLAA